LGNKQDNFQLHRFTTSDNIAKKFYGGLLFLLTLYKPTITWSINQNTIQCVHTPTRYYTDARKPY